MNGPKPRRQVVERCRGMAGELALVRAGRSNYEIVANGVFLMATYNRRSERAMARLGLAALAAGAPPRAAGATAAAEARPARTAAPGARVLIGGLGVGYTLAAVLADARVGQAVVVELEPKVVEWNRRYFGVGRAALEDPRVSLVVGDFFAYLRDLAQRDRDPAGLPGEAFDLILADTDNGPDWLVRPENYAIYGRRGLELAYAALAPGGAAAFWSAAESPTFVANLRAAGFEVSVRPVPARRVLPPDVIYLGRKPPAATQS